jgi:hypothetical protein
MPDASTDEIDEILTTSPGALVRHGSAVVGVIAVAMIALSYFVQYPDVVSGRITLLTEDPPAPVLARADGLVERLFVRDGACVNRSSLLGRVATTGDGDAMQALTEKITDAEARHEDPSELAVRLQIEPHTNLGSLHTTYVALMAAITAYEELERHDYDRQRTGLHNQQRASFKALNQQVRDLVKLLGRNVELAELRKGRDLSLRTSGVLSHEATEASQGEVLQRRIDLGLTRLSQVNMVLQALQSENSFLDVELQLEDEQRERRAAVQAEFRRLQLEALQWETAHVMRAPIDGCVSLRRVWSDHQAVRVGDEVMVLLPSGSPVVGRVQLTQVGAGKVAAGQPVTIQPDSFPMYEFGVLHAEVASVSAMADEIGFVATVTLAQGLRTDQGISLDFRQGMQGTAVVVTRERRLLERVFSQFYVALFGDRVRLFR